MSNPSLDLVNALTGNLSLTKNSNLFVGRPRGPDSSVPKNAIFIYNLGGPAPTRFMGLTREIRFALIGIQTRWAKEAAGTQKAQAVQKHLQDISISGYLDVASTQALPTSLGTDENGLFSFLTVMTMVFDSES